MAGRIVFCGVGALGSNAAMLCRNLDAELVFIDFDRVESKNLLSQAYVKPSIGKNKAEALRLQFLNFYGIKTEAFGIRLSRENTSVLLEQATLLVDCFDNVEGRILLSEYARSAGKPLVHGAISADGTFGLVRWEERFLPDSEDVAGQATCEGGAHLPMIGFLSAALARVIQDFHTNNWKKDTIVSLSGASVSEEERLGLREQVLPRGYQKDRKALRFQGLDQHNGTGVDEGHVRARWVGLVRSFVVRAVGNNPPIQSEVGRPIRSRSAPCRDQQTHGERGEMFQDRLCQRRSLQSC